MLWLGTSGDASYYGSTSSSLTQMVKSDLTTTLTLSPNPVARRQTLTITGSASNTGTVSESVTFSYTITAPNGTMTSYSLGTVTIGAGQTVSRTATYKVPPKTPIGTYTVSFTAQDKTGSSSSTAQVTVS